MTDRLPFLMIPGLNCSALLYANQIPALEQLGPVSVGDHTRDDTIEGMAKRILAAAPARFHLIALSMGGYVAFEILRQAASRVGKVALLDTSARADLPQHSERRLKFIHMAETGKFPEINDTLFPLLVHPDRKEDTALRAIVDKMAEETGPEAFIRQQRALISRPDSRAFLPSINNETLVMVGDSDKLIPPEQSEEIASGIPGATLQFVKDSGHLPVLERPEETTAALIAFFGR